MTVVMWIIVIVLLMLIAVVAFACLMYVYNQYTGGIVL